MEEGEKDFNFTSQERGVWKKHSPHSLLPVEEEGTLLDETEQSPSALDPAGTYTSPVTEKSRGIFRGEHSPGEQSMVTGR